MIIVDTGAVVGLLDRGDRNHGALAALFEREGHRWLLPWAILPEVDYLATTRLGDHVALAFSDDVRAGRFQVEGDATADLARALELRRQYADLRLGLVDSVVLACAERHRARAIATLDLRHFRAVRLALPRQPRLIPGDDPAQ